ncbi:hypothetical protein JXA88_04175 [Candidatus Fermentibacteria bacterium]|nr:hypothetical protein [Candidatus Fermentibacteria bacterium]
MDLVSAWVAAFLTLAIYSFLYKDNPLYRFAESLFVGLSLGYEIGIVLHRTIIPNLFQKLAADPGRNWYLVIGGVLGIMLYLRYVQRVSFLGRWALAVYMGYFVGVELMQRLHGDVLPQVKDTMLPLLPLSLASVQNLLVLVGVLSVLVYFYFSRPHTGILRPVSRLGIWFIMVCFGASFGYTVMARISLLVGRLTFLVDDWVRPTLAAILG